jgi:hypothetical protein
VRPSRRPKRLAWCCSAPAGSTGTAIRTTPDFVGLADPDGNRFCIVDLAHEYT